LQLLLFTVLGDMQDTTNFGKTLNMFESIDETELQTKMKETMESTAREVESSVQTAASDFEKDWADTTAGLSSDPYVPLAPPPPSYQNPGKKWRLKRGATPQWYKARQGVRTKAQSGAARVARFRPVKRSEHV